MPHPSCTQRNEFRRAGAFSTRRPRSSGITYFRHRRRTITGNCIRDAEHGPVVVVHWWFTNILSSCHTILDATFQQIIFATATLQRDCLGSWNAQASDRYARMSLRIVANMQSSLVEPRTRRTGSRRRFRKIPHDLACCSRVNRPVYVSLEIVTASKGPRRCSRTTSR